jgi:pilus assembly protein Flp/PilA
MDGGIMMKDMFVRLVREEDGQGLTEYGLIIGLVALAVIIALGTLGDEISALFDRISDKLGEAGVATANGEGQ